MAIECGVTTSTDWGFTAYIPDYPDIENLNYSATYSEDMTTCWVTFLDE